MRVDREGADLAGIESTTVMKSEAAPQILRHGKFDVTFLDYEMAFPDGATLARQMLPLLPGAQTAIAGWLLPVRKFALTWLMRKSVPASQ